MENFAKKVDSHSHNIQKSLRALKDLSSHTESLLFQTYKTLFLFEETTTFLHDIETNTENTLIPPTRNQLEIQVAEENHHSLDISRQKLMTANNQTGKENDDTNNMITQDRYQVV